MKSLKLNGCNYRIIKGLVLKGSIKKSERVLRAVRPIIKGGNIDHDRLIARLRFADPLRAKYLASFLNHIRASYNINDLEQIYVERKSYRKSYRIISRGRTHMRITPYFRFVGLLRLN